MLADVQITSSDADSHATQRRDVVRFTNHSLENLTPTSAACTARRFRFTDSAHAITGGEI